MSENALLTRAAEARLRAPKTRGAFRPIDAAKRQLGLLQAADGDGQAAVSWLIDLEQRRVVDARHLAFGSRWSHAVADAFTQLARGMTVAEACAIRPATVEAMLRDEPGVPACPEAELAFIPDLQRRALAALPLVRLLPKPAEKLVYQRKRQQDWSEEDRRWLPLSLLKKIKAVDEVAKRVLADKAPAATCRIEGLHDDFRVVCLVDGIAADAKPTLGLFLGSALRALHPGLSVELAEEAGGASAPAPTAPPPAAAAPAPAAEPRSFTAEDYKYGFKTDVEAVALAKGLNEDIVRQISAARGEPDFLLQFRLKAYAAFTRMREPTWARVDYPPIDYQAITYYSAPKQAESHASLDEIDPKIRETFEKLGIPLDEQKRLSGVAVDAVFDSVSVATTHQEKLHDAGVIFCPIREAVQLYPALVERWIGSVVPAGDNWFAALNSAVFSDGSFVYIPPHVRCPLELSTYFRINNTESGQFERTLIIADQGSHVSYLEGCTAPKTSKNQLHAAVVELVAERDAEIKYSTVQNWFAGDPQSGAGGVYNFVTKRGLCRGERSKISWTQVEAGSAITWKYPSCVLKGDDSVGEFYSVALTNGRMQADTGTKMIHIGKRTRSTIISKGISAERSRNVYRGLVQVMKSAEGARNYTCCDSMLVGKACEAHTYPYVDVQRADAQVEHEASTSRLSEDQLFYLQSRGIAHEEAVGAIVNGFAKDVLAVLPMEFAAEARKLLQIKLENSVG